MTDSALVQADTPLTAAEISFHILDFTKMPATGVIKPGFYYTFSPEGDEDAEAEIGQPGVFLNGPYPTFEDTKSQAESFIADALTSFMGDGLLDVADEEVHFIDEKADADPTSSLTDEEDDDYVARVVPVDVEEQVS